MDDPRLDNLEIKLAFAQEELVTLGGVVADKDRRLMQLEERVERLETALRVLAQRVSAPAGEDIGAHPEEDPVPRSG